MIPQILTDKSRLQEIYDLRVKAWEGSERTVCINSTIFPNGWSEDIDKEAYHFVILDENNKIAASARISLHHSLYELPCADSFIPFTLPASRPFAFYSRLVVHPKWRSSFFLKKLDLARVQFLKDNDIPFAIATCTEKRVGGMLRLGFKSLGKTLVKFPYIEEEEALIILLK